MKLQYAGIIKPKITSIGKKLTEEIEQKATEEGFPSDLVAKCCGDGRSRSNQATIRDRRELEQNKCT